MREEMGEEMREMREEMDEDDDDDDEIIIIILAMADNNGNDHNHNLCGWRKGRIGLISWAGPKFNKISNKNIEYRIKKNVNYNK